jgi:hypothetical protein
LECIFNIPNSRNFNISRKKKQMISFHISYTKGGIYSTGITLLANNYSDAILKAKEKNILEENIVYIQKKN